MATVNRFTTSGNLFTLGELDENDLILSGQATFTTPGTTTWTAPTGVTSVCVAVVGGGGGAGGSTGITTGSGGGGGGGLAYANDIPVTAGTSYNLKVGGGGIINTDGTSSWFQTSSFLYANGGSAGTDGSGGTGIAAVGQQLYTTTGASGSLGSVTAPTPVSNQYTYTFTAPAGVGSVSVVAVGGGGGGSNFYNPSGSIYGGGGAGGGGGALAYAYNCSVIAGNSYTVVVGGPGAAGAYGTGAGGNGGTSSFNTNYVIAGGGGGGGAATLSAGGSGGAGGTVGNGYNGYLGGAGGRGGNGYYNTVPVGDSAGGGGGGAGGYAGAGGQGADAAFGGAAGQAGNAATASSGGAGGGSTGGTNTNGYSASAGSGGGVGVNGAGSTGGATGIPSNRTSTSITSYGGNAGSGGTAGGTNTATSSYTNSAAGSYGGGGGAQGYGNTTASGGAVRIIWGPGRSFPGSAYGGSTLTVDQPVVAYAAPSLGGGGGGGAAGYNGNGGNGGTASLGSTYPGGGGGTSGGTATGVVAYTGGNGGSAYGIASAYTAATLGTTNLNLNSTGGAGAGGAGGINPIGGGGVGAFGKAPSTASVNNSGYTTTAGSATALSGANTGTAVSTHNGGSGGSDGTYTGQAQGQMMFTASGTFDATNNRYYYSWTVPTGVTSICAVCIGAGGQGGTTTRGSGGGGGGIAWANDIPVTPGAVYYITVGAAGSISTAKNGGTSSISLGASYSPIMYATGGTNGIVASGTYTGGYSGGGGGAGGWTHSGWYGGSAQDGGYGQPAGGSGGSGGGSVTGLSTYAGGAGGNGSATATGGYNYLAATGANGGGTGYDTGSGGGGAGYIGGSGGGTGVAPSALTNGTAGQGALAYLVGGSYYNGGDGGSTAGGSGTSYGGGGPGGSTSITGAGAVRIIWGPGRAFPATMATDQSTIVYNSSGKTGGTYGGGGVGGVNSTGSGGDGFVRIIWGKTRKYPGVLTEDRTYTSSIPGLSRRITSAGKYTVSGKFDEISMNPNAIGSLQNAALTMPYAAAQNLGSNNFTIEGWVYITGSSGQNTILSNSAFSLIVDQSSQWLEFICNTGTTVDVHTATNSFLRNTWHHFAVVRNSNTILFYIDGTLSYSTALTGTIAYPSGTTDLKIGFGYLSTTSFTAGYIADLQLIKGTALYTGSTMTIPDTTFVMNPTNTVFRFKPYKSSYEEAGPNSYTLTGTGTSSAFHPFKPPGYYSVAFTSSGTYEEVIASTAGIIDQRGDFTLEFWINPSARPTLGDQYAYIFATSAYANTNQLNSYNVALNYQGKIVVNRWSAATVTSDSFTSTAVLTNGTWYHIALVRIGVGTNNVKLYIDGVLDSQTTQSAVCAALSTYNATIGYQGNLYIAGGAIPSQLNAYISNLRYTNGIGVYTGAFTMWNYLPLRKTQTSDTNIAAITSTSSVALITCNSSRFLDTSSNNVSVVQGPGGTYNPAISVNYPPKFTNSLYSGLSPGNLVYSGTGLTVSKMLSTGDFLPVGYVDDTNITTGTALYTSPGADTWQCPGEVITIGVACIGGGSSGSSNGGSYNSSPGAPTPPTPAVSGPLGYGGGGGALAWANFRVVPGETYSLNVGDNGSFVNDGYPAFTVTYYNSSSSWFGSPSTLNAGGGGGGYNWTAGGTYSVGVDATLVDKLRMINSGGGNGGAGGTSGNNWSNQVYMAPSTYTLYYYGGGGGGGGAGGYSGNGGNGGACGNSFGGNSSNTGGAGGNGSGGAGGGGGGGSDGLGSNNSAFSKTGGYGGGVGILVAGSSGLGGSGAYTFGGNPSTNGGATSGGVGSGGGYGYGAPGGQFGGGGAVRIVYSYQNNRTYPNNST